MSLRRSDRLSTKLDEYYKTQYARLKPLFLVLAKQCLHLSAIERINKIIKLMKYFKRIYQFAMKYEYKYVTNKQYEIFGDMIYLNSIRWCAEAKIQCSAVNNAILISNKLHKASIEFRIIYENLKCEHWQFICDKYKLDKNITCLITSFLHFYIKSN
jgi:hypothetical protein